MPTETPSISEPRKSADTRNRLIRQAIKLFWLHGYTEVSIATIAKASRAQKGSVYHFFPSKFDLLKACQRYMEAIHQKKLLNLIDAKSDPIKTLLTYVKLLCREQKRAAKRYGFVPGFFYMSINAALSEQDEELSLQLQKSFANQKALIEELLSRAVDEGKIHCDVEAVSNSVIFLTMGGVWQARANNDVKLLDDLTVSISNLFNSLS